MDSRQNRHLGCLTGLAIGDAMGRPVDKRTIDQIRSSYGPLGLQGYDLMNGKAEVGAYTQIAAFTCNALLAGLTQGKTGSLTPWLTLGLQEWGASQRPVPDSGKKRCWVSHVPSLHRRCDAPLHLMDTVLQGRFGSVGKCANRFCAPEPLAAAVAAGLYYQENRLNPTDIGKLGAQAMALTQGAPMAAVSGALLSFLIAGILNEPGLPLSRQVKEAAGIVAAQFSAFPEAAELRSMALELLKLSRDSAQSPQSVMERLGCCHAHTVLLGGIFAAVSAGEDFDAALVTAVNHSGCSAGTAAIAGALLGGTLGAGALPEFYLDSLEAAGPVRQLALDLTCQAGQVIFDDDWDRKYVQGEPLA